MGVSCRKGPTFGTMIAEERKSHRPVSGSWQRRGGRGGAWRRFRSPESTSQAVLGSSLEPVILQPRVTWMPGIPEPLGSGLPPPSLPPFEAQRPSPAQPLL